MTIALPALAASDSCGNPLAPPSASIDGAATHVYKSPGGRDLRLHVIQPRVAPESANPPPAMVLFFGGGWLRGDVLDLLPAAQYFAGRGIVAILADYRVYCRDGVTVPAEMSDARSAMRWVRAHARDLGIDPDRIVAAGSSAGGHLAASTAVFDAFDDPQDDPHGRATPDALLLFFPCVDLDSELERQYSGAAIGNHGRDVSPLYHVRAGMPPVIALVGTADPLQGEIVAYCDALRAAGNDCRLTQYEGARHGFLSRAVDGGKWFAPAMRDADRELVRLGYLR